MLGSDDYVDVNLNDYPNMQEHEEMDEKMMQKEPQELSEKTDGKKQDEGFGNFELE